MRLRPLLSGVAVAAALAAVMLLGSLDSAHATTFNPTVTTSVQDPTAGKPSDFTSALDIPDGDVNFAAFISYIPTNWGVVTGDYVPTGAPVGVLKAASVLGLINGACNTDLPVTFDMMNGSLDMTKTVSFNDVDNNNTPDFADTDSNGFFLGVTKYPDWLTRIFKDPVTDAPQQPIRRSIGVTPVAGTPIILQFLVFPPGTQINASIPHDVSQGFPSVTVLENIGDTSAVPAPGIINDFCSPLSTSNVSFGTTPGGDQLFVNPSDGKYTFGTFALGQRDADGDGYENSLDTCPLTPNVGNPRITGDGDLDTDGLDAACDPNDNVAGGTNSDQDGDGYQNRQDNCPLKANGQEQDAVAGVGNQKDTDMDTIGDACDPNPTTADTEGVYSVSTPAADVTIGAGGTAAGTRPTKAQCPHCWVGGYGHRTRPSSRRSRLPARQHRLLLAVLPAPAPPPHRRSQRRPGNTDSGSSNTVIFVVVGVIAAIIVIGGGAALMMRNKKSA